MTDSITSYMAFQTYDESFVVNAAPPTHSVPNILNATGNGPAVWSPTNLFAITAWSMEIEQTLNIGNQSGGAGSGKVSFDPLSITRKVDSLSPALFGMACSGTPFHRVYIIERRTSANKSAAPAFGAWLFGLCAVKTINWTLDPSVPAEVVTFEYGQLIQGYQTTVADGSAGPVLVRGWDRVKNVSTTTVP